MTPEELLRREGLQLPVAHPVVGNHVPCARSGSLVLVAGHGPFVNGQPSHTGKVGRDLSVEAGRRAAETVMMNILSSLKLELGELARISRFVRRLVLVNAVDGFAEHAAVADGATEGIERAAR